MRLLVTILPECVDSGECYLTLYAGDAEDRVGPIQHGVPIEAILEPPVRPPPKGVSRKLRKTSKRHEEEVAGDLGGRAQKASGALPWAKGDVRVRGKLRVELKTTGTKSYRVTREELTKIRGECGQGERPAFVVTFIDPRTHREEDRWVLTPYEDWHATNIDHGSGTEKR